MRNLIIGLSAVVSLTGCGVSWASIDKSKINNDHLQLAKQKCKIDEKKYKLNEEQNKISYMISAANIKGEAKKQWEETSEKKEIEFNREINQCMKKEGYIKEI